MKGVREAANKQLQSGSAAVEKDIVDNLSSFLSHHDVNGGKPKEE